MKVKKILFIAAMTTVFCATGCLKTRAQIRNETGARQDVENEEGETVKGGAPRGGKYELEEIKTELTRVSGKLDEVEHAQRQHSVQELKDYITRVDGRVSELEKNQVLIMTELKDLKDEKEGAKREAQTPASELFVEANTLLKIKKFEEAGEKFKALLNKGLKGKELAEAHFGLGEVEYGLKNFKKAIVQYSKVQEVFAKSPKVPTSLYKIGLAFQHLSMGKEAKGFFQELLERYPKSPEAKKARAKAKE